jgi:hypothetical protein
MIGGIRARFSNTDQIEENFIVREYSIFGGSTKNSISPLSYQDPNQQQNLIIDIPQSIILTPEKAVQIEMVAEQTLTLALFIPSYDKVAG